ncbi:hypothetical protein HZH68_000206 [Vespula germanica]|uniref:Uncharacterized protein n=1 Tax=Vespula germanica TaxID=30212 RepID=A0A834NTD8_VESGE|nr:hypothetical protein HZH68_000206 [Vespula germanica]
MIEESSSRSRLFRSIDDDDDDNDDEDEDEDDNDYVDDDNRSGKLKSLVALEDILRVGITALLPWKGEKIKKSIGFVSENSFYPYECKRGPPSPTPTPTSTSTSTASS